MDLGSVVVYQIHMNTNEGKMKEIFLFLIKCFWIIMLLVRISIQCDKNINLNKKIWLIIYNNYFISITFFYPYTMLTKILFKGDRSEYKHANTLALLGTHLQNSTTHTHNSHFHTEIAQSHQKKETRLQLKSIDKQDLIIRQFFFNY